jgi:hypothetical protein
MGWRQDWRQATFWLLFSVLAFSWGDLLFGMYVRDIPLQD